MPKGDPRYRRAPRRVRKGAKPNKQLVTKPMLSRAIANAHKFDTEVYTSDALTLSCSTTQTYLDLSAALYTAESITGMGMKHKHLVFKGQVSAVDSPNYVRFIIFKWKPNTADATPGSDDIIRNDASATTPFGIPQWQNRKSYKILYDHLYHVDYPNTTVPYNIPFHIKLSAKQLGDCTFNKGLNTGSDHIYFLYCSDSNIASHPSMLGNLRVLYEADNS